MNTANAVAPKLLRRALRTLLLLGAPVVWWLLFCGGAAQAEDLENPKGASAVLQPDVLQPTTKTLTGSLRQVPTAAASAVARSTASAPDPVRATTAAALAEVEPTLSDATALLADDVDEAARTADATLRPVLQAAGLARPAASIERTAASSTPIAHPAKRAHFPESVAQASPVLGGNDSTRSAGQHASPVRVVDEHSSERGPGTVPTEAGITPTGSGGSSSGAAAVLALLLLIPPAAIGRRRPRRSDSVSAGPAYPPGSSPD